MKFSEIKSLYCEKDGEYEAKRDKLKARIDFRQQQIDRLEKRLSQHNEASPFWIDELIRPIAHAMQGYLPGYSPEIFGPFGIGATTSIHFYRDGITGEDRFLKGTDNCLSIAFKPGSLEKGELFLVDYTRNTERFLPGSMGEINGLNHPRVEIPDDADGKWFVDFMFNQEEG